MDPLILVHKGSEYVEAVIGPFEDVDEAVETLEAKYPMLDFSIHDGLSGPDEADEVCRLLVGD